MRVHRFKLGLLTVLLGMLLFQTAAFADVDKVSISQMVQKGNDVYLYVSTLDEAGMPVTDAASAEQFCVNIGRGEALPVQAADVFSAVDQGASYIFCVDISKSVTQQEMEEIRSSISDFISGMPDQDYARIITIGSEITSVCDPTNDRDALNAAVWGIERNADYTYLYKGISYALAGQRKNVAAMPDRTAIVLFTDGMDDSDGASSEELVLEELAEARIPVYVVGLKGQDPSANLNSAGQIARQSGGSVFSYIDMSISDAVETIRDIMDTTYRLRVRPEDDAFGMQDLIWNVTYNGDGYSVSSANYTYALGMEDVVLGESDAETEQQPEKAKLAETQQEITEVLTEEKQQKVQQTPETEAAPRQTNRSEEAASDQPSGTGETSEKPESQEAELQKAEPQKGAETELPNEGLADPKEEEKQPEEHLVEATEKKERPKENAQKETETEASAEPKAQETEPQEATETELPNEGLADPKEKEKQPEEHLVEATEKKEQPEENPQKETEAEASAEPKAQETEPQEKAEAEQPDMQQEKAEAEQPDMQQEKTEAEQSNTQSGMTEAGQTEMQQETDEAQNIQAGTETAETDAFAKQFGTEQMIKFVQDNAIICIASGLVLLALIIILVSLLQRKKKEREEEPRITPFYERNIPDPDSERPTVGYSYDDEKTIDEIEPFDDEATVDGTQDSGISIRFEITFHGQTETIDRILKDQLILGRGDECDVDVVLHSALEERKQTSRKHAVIVSQPDGLYVVDNSKNKTYLNGTEIIEKALLRDEDVLQMGKAAVKVKILGC